MINNRQKEGAPEDVPIIIEPEHHRDQIGRRVLVSSPRPLLGKLVNVLIPHSASETTSTFSLRDAAFYTERKYPISQSSTQLRYKTINFVSAGSEAPLSRVEEDDKHTPTTSLQTEAQDEGQFQDVPSEEFASMSLHPGAKGTDDATAQVGNAEDLTPQPLFVEDKVGTAEKPFTGLPDPELRSSSPVSSDSSEEVIVFRGRNPQKPISNDQRPENSTGPRQSSDSFPQGVQDPTSGPKVPTQAIVCAQSISPEPEQPSWDNTPGNWGHQGERRTRREQKMTGGIEAAMDSAFLSRPSNSKETRRLQNRELRLLKENEESFDDYISNLIENGEDDVFHEGVQSGTRNLPLDDGQDGFAGAEATVIRREQDQRPNQDEGWGSAELDDYDNMSTSDDTFNIVSLILRKRERPSGTQYLVVHRGDTIDDAKWRPGHTITSESELEVVTKFEEENNMEWEDDDESDDDQDDDAEIDDYDLENESEIDELDLVERMKDRMTDEHIARILSKQEELGIGSDDIVLFDGIEEGEDDEFGTYTYGRGYSSSARGPTRAKGKNSRKKGYPMEEQPYGDFDIMDRDRPGLRPVSGRGPPVAYGVSDEELRAVMQSTWAADREKKKIRKQEREELRAQGLLGGGNKKADLSTRYSQGIGAQQILDEIRAFLGSSHERYPVHSSCYECLTDPFTVNHFLR